ncbi:hypothetical protein GLP31_20125 [Photobacterium carnosum]|uniref:hypothetical protein n=1 Tax=Photobacterium carnosum TaxID=2023717 RepID=UPI001E4737EF|nr:hypothetical protein [Photobacterium carnosum]MCD9554775.1 hypothetical protein [Photobacterium carnosum]
MNKHQQSGMTTLLITSMLLIVALLFSLASYKNLFYQIKRTQNEVLARQAHWAAEGGLECGFAEISNKSDVNTSLDKCKKVIDGQLLTLSIDTDDGKSQLTSKTDNDYKKITKTIVAGGAKSSGVIKSSADLYFNGDYNISPDYNLVNGKYHCNIIRYLRNIYIHQASSGIGNANADNPDDTKQCEIAYKTTKALKRIDFKSDIYKDLKLDLFKETFGTNRKNWKEVKDKYFLDGDKLIGTCLEKITSEEAKKKRYIWITGDCVIDETIDKKDNNGVFVLIHNGKLHIKGSFHNSGVFYHFIDDSYSDNVDWSDTFLDIAVFSDIYDTSDDDELSISDEVFNKMTITYLEGSVTYKGGFIFDAPNHLVYLRAAIDLSFDDSLINDLLAPFGKPTWQQGSWHDF